MAERLIYVYEDIENKTFYVGLTCNLKKRHIQHNTKKHGKYDNLKNYFNSVDQPLPTPKVLETGLNDEEAQIREDYWLKDYLSKGWKAINKAKTGKDKSSLGNPWIVHTKEEWFEICRRQAQGIAKRSHFFKEHPHSYMVATENGWLDYFFGETTKKEKNYWTEERVLTAVSECTSKMELFEKYPRVYDIIKQKGLLDEYYTNVIPRHKEHYKKNDAIVEEILKLNKENLSLRKISKKIGVPKTTVARILKEYM